MWRLPECGSGGSSAENVAAARRDPVGVGRYGDEGAEETDGDGGGRCAAERAAGDAEGGAGGEQGLGEKMGERESVRVEEIIPMVLHLVRSSLS